MTDDSFDDETDDSFDGPEGDSEGVRLQKVIAAAGIASRRASEMLIEEGRVEVNGKVVVEQGLRVDPERDTIRVDGARIPPPRRHVYLVFNKPRGVVSTLEDPEGRTTISDYLDQRGERRRLFHVGRLDTETEGLLILTNDGDFGHKLAHPSYEVPKTYVAEIEGNLEQNLVQRLRKGVTLEDGPVRPDEVRVISRAADRSMVSVTLHEGRNRIVRRMFDTVGHPVRKLSRTAIGPVRVGQLKAGEMRDLTRDELGGLLDLVSTEHKAVTRPRRPAGKRPASSAAKSAGKSAGKQSSGQRPPSQRPVSSQRRKG